MEVPRIGLDIAKNVFQVHGVDKHGKTVIRKQLKRAELMPFFAQTPPCLIGIEACAGSHDWARRLRALGHDARLMAAQFVSPYRKGGKAGKNDKTDAEAICEAVGRPAMRFVPVKTVDQQAILAVHRVRDSSVAERTALVNQIRGVTDRHIGARSRSAYWSQRMTGILEPLRDRRIGASGGSA